MEDFCSYVGQAIDLFRYDPRSPMLFSSGLFLFVFLGFSLIYGLLKRRLTLRIVYVTLFSLYFYYKTSGLFFLLLVGLSLSDFAIGRLMHRSRRSEARKSLLVLSLLINLGLLCYFKYADLIVSAVAGLIDRTLTLPDIFLPVGISFFLFQSMSYVIDVGSEMCIRDSVGPVQESDHLGLYQPELRRPGIRQPHVVQRLREPDGGLRVRPADLLRLLGILRYGDRAGPAARLPVPGQLRFALPVGYDHRVLAALAYLAVELAEGLPLHFAGREPQGARGRMRT